MKALKTITIDIGNGFWGMMQEDIKTTGVVNFFVTHEDYGVIMLAFGIEEEWNDDLLMSFRDNLIEHTAIYKDAYMD
jgi:hypothetical protein